MDWSEVQTPREDAIYAMAQAQPKWAEKKRLGLGPLAATAVPSRDRNAFYLQFSSECERKWEMSDRLIAIWRADELDLPKFERMPEPIVPSSLDTIDVSGPSWRD